MLLSIITSCESCRNTIAPRQAAEIEPRTVTLWLDDHQRAIARRARSGRLRPIPLYTKRCPRAVGERDVDELYVRGVVKRTIAGQHPRQFRRRNVDGGDHHPKRVRRLIVNPLKRCISKLVAFEK